jgi:AraC-like DNA-binding protein
MCKMFKEATGSNFLSHVKDARLAEAARLLEEGRESVQEIAKRVGFGGPAYFIRVFKGRYGQTPLDYRRSRRGARNST